MAAARRGVIDDLEPGAPDGRTVVAPWRSIRALEPADRENVPCAEWCRSGQGERLQFVAGGLTPPTTTMSLSAPATACVPIVEGRVLVVGRGRMGRALTSALSVAGVDVDGPAERGATGEDAALVLLAVPDDAIAQASALIRPGRMVGHLSGAHDLDPLRPHEALGLHPLMTVTGSGAAFAGASAAVDGSSARALETARRLAEVLGMSPIRVHAADRAAYHAAASIAANFLIVLEDAAEQLAATAGVSRAALAPLVRASAENWISAGADALTGPVARGDEATLARQRAAVAERLPDRLAMFDTLVAAARDVAARAVREERP